ncbi:MAG: hypothetical protein KME49_21780 [Brasilonema octagenarum HA4186-MV1]|nr:hypothetical protein [Brasilonema octagenarum HA4186-MV1]
MTNERHMLTPAETLLQQVGNPTALPSPKGRRQRRTSRHSRPTVCLPKAVPPND